ncbi:branched-chain amino acid ABC transporter permease [Patulibacter brassicae]|jgi:branched-subunit amino acid ABC-type transport system permease component|uniref:Branched-chain amino acid ABC transporter permease n=1 Tax=Patulibacter brassicae TaxID=1705717 RepID=A0ABU4VMM4_9ACTN|nr:branched-chain amino acid ABC transporter permease [Patulibacter brassicae]MDX8152700.1 branched-chain amino acid ABC transporter permease [Patulibacter brassicae]
MDFVIAGLIMGGLYALIAQGFVLTFLTTRTLNFALGEFLVLGAVIGMGVGSWGWLPDAGKVAFVILTVGILGAIVYRFLVLPFTTEGPHDARWLLSTVGLSFVILNLLTNSQGATPKALGYGGFGEFSTVLGVRVTTQALVIAILAIAITALLVLMTTRTPLGLLMRAVSEDADTAALMGVSPRRIGMLAYAIAMGIAALAGVLWASQVGVSVHMGLPLLVAAFACGVIGGLTSLWGPLLGGAIYGVLTHWASFELGGVWGETAGLLLVVVVLIFRPEGLLGRRLEAKL